MRAACDGFGGGNNLSLQFPYNRSQRGLGYIQQQMNSKYEVFYSGADYSIGSSDDYNDFQPCDLAQLSALHQGTKNAKIYDYHLPSTANTHYYQTISADTEPEGKQNMGKVDYACEWDNKESENKVDGGSNRKIRKIETSVACLYKTVRTYRGCRLQTNNISKFFTNVLKQYVKTLAICKIVPLSQFHKFQHKKQYCQLLPSDCESKTRQLCLGFIQGKEFLHRIMSSGKMNYSTKIVALKYLQKLREKLSDSGTSEWKQQL